MSARVAGLAEDIERNILGLRVADEVTAGCKVIATVQVQCDLDAGVDVFDAVRGGVQNLTQVGPSARNGAAGATGRRAVVGDGPEV